MHERFKALCEQVAQVPVYPDRLPVTADLPAISFLQISRASERALDDRVALITLNWQVRVTANRRQEAQSIAKRLYALETLRISEYQRLVIENEMDEPQADGTQVCSVMLNISTTLRNVTV